MNMEAQMRMDEVNKLRPGVYYLHWKGGGGSLAVVGVLPDGTRWFAPFDRTGETLERRGIASSPEMPESVTIPEGVDEQIEAGKPPLAKRHTRP
jgi:hypothetical protein